MCTAAPSTAGRFTRAFRFGRARYARTGRSGDRQRKRPRREPGLDGDRRAKRGTSTQTASDRNRADILLPLGSPRWPSAQGPAAVNPNAPTDGLVSLAQFMSPILGASSAVDLSRPWRANLPFHSHGGTCTTAGAAV